MTPDPPPKNGRGFDSVNGNMYYDGTWYRAGKSWFRQHPPDGPLTDGVEISGGDVRLFLPNPVARALIRQLRRLDRDARDSSGKYLGERDDDEFSMKSLIASDRAKVTERLDKAKQGINQALSAWRELGSSLDEWNDFKEGGDA